MKEIVILALKDREGNLYSCNSYVYDGRALKLKKLEKDNMVETPVIEVFPYQTFSSFSIINEEEYSYTYARILAKIDNKTYRKFRAGDARSVTLLGKKVQLIEEVLNPFEVGYEVFKKSLLYRPYNDSSNIRYGLLSWQYCFGFNSDKEYEFYKKLFFYTHPVYEFSRRYTFIPNPENEEYLERVLEDKIPIEVSLRETGVAEGINLERLMRLVNKFSEEAFLFFNIHTRLNYAKKLKKDRVNRSLYDRYMQETKEDITEITFTMPIHVIEEYGGDDLLQMAFENLDWLLVSSGYEPSVEYLDYDYDYDDDYISHSYIYDGRDQEVEMIEEFLPYVTEKSIPLLEQLVFEKIERYLPQHIKEILKTKEV